MGSSPFRSSPPCSFSFFPFLRLFRCPLSPFTSHDKGIVHIRYVCVREVGERCPEQHEARNGNMSNSVHEARNTNTSHSGHEYGAKPCGEERKASGRSVLTLTVWGKGVRTVDVLRQTCARTKHKKFHRVPFRVLFYGAGEYTDMSAPRGRRRSGTLLLFRLGPGFSAPHLTRPFPRRRVISCGLRTSQVR